MIKNLVLDVDGVLTDGHFHVSDNGVITKTFNCRDYDAIHRLQHIGITVILLSNDFHCLQYYADAVGCEAIHVDFKLKKIDMLSNRLSEELTQTLYCGDSLHDLDCLRTCGYAFVPRNAEYPLRLEFTVLKRNGGEGIVEELEGNIKSINNPNMYLVSLVLS
jgi:3-deoxy-D-manno-octulosonate 8-phosphate phosphatase (KDO 8-P phosphatase)